MTLGPATPARFLAAVAAVLTFAAPAAAETMDEAMAAALATHPTLRADQANVKAAEEAVATARSGFFPSLGLSSELDANAIYRQAGYVSLYGRSATARVDQMIFDGFRTARLADAAEADRAAAAADMHTDANSVLFQGLRAYMYVLRDRELVAAAKRFLGEHEKSIVRVSEIAKHDPGKAFDLVQLEMRAAMARSFVTEREGALQSSESQFRETIGHPPGKLDPSRRLPAEDFKSLDAVLAEAQALHPSIVATGERVRRRQAERDQAGALLWPRLDLTARYTKGWDRQTLSGVNDDAYAGVTASYALSAGGGQITAVRSAEQQEASWRERQNAARRDVREGVRVAWAQREALSKTVPLSATYLKHAFEVVDGYEAQYSFGKRSVLELLLIRNEIYTSESRLIGLTYEQHLADYALAAQMGVLTRYFPSKPATATP